MPDWLDRLLGLPVSSRSLGPNGAVKGLELSLEPGGFVTELRGLSTSPSRAADTETLQGLMSANELVYSCIDIKATAAIDPRLIVERRVKDGDNFIWQEDRNHPFRQLMMRPNADMTEGDLMRAAIVSWDVSNPRRFFAEKEYRNGVLVALHPLDPTKMKPLASRSDATKMIGYVWRSGTQRREYDLDELLIRRAPTWYQPPPLAAALGATESDTAQTEYIRSFFNNGGIPPGILKYNMPLTQPKRDEIRDRWLATYGNRYGRSHDIGVLDVNAEFIKTGANLDEIHSQTLRSVAESRICMVFRVPPLIVYAYVGLIRATYSNLKEAWAGFWDATMSPAFKEWRAFWLWSLLPEFEDEGSIRSEDVRLQYDMSQVAALQDDVDAAHNRARNNFAAGGISLNEFRSAIGAAAVAGGDDLYSMARPLAPLPVGAELVDLGAIGAPKERKDRNAPGLQVYERSLERLVADYLAAEYRKAAQAVEDEN